MIQARIHSSQQQATSTQRSFAVGRWRVWTALLTAITFAVLVSTAAMHHHATAAEDQECAVCSVVTHKISGSPLVNLSKLTLVLVHYAPYLPVAPAAVHVSPLLLPPGCGPPASAIC